MTAHTIAPRGHSASLPTSTWQVRPEPGGEAPAKEVCRDAASGWTIPGESCSGRTMLLEEQLPLAADWAEPGWVTGGAGRLGQPLCRQWWQHSGSSSPCISGGQRTQSPEHTEPALSLVPRRRLGPQHLATARVPSQCRGCGSGRAAGRGKSAFPPLLAPGERGSFFIQGFAARAFQLPLEPRLLCHRVGDKGRPKKSELRLEGWAAIAGSGECGIRFLCLYGLAAFYFFSFILGGYFGNPGLSPDVGNARQKQMPQPPRAFLAWDHGSSADQENA